MLTHYAACTINKWAFSATQIHILLESRTVSIAVLYANLPLRRSTIHRALLRQQQLQRQQQQPQQQQPQQQQPQQLRLRQQVVDRHAQM